VEVGDDPGQRRADDRLVEREQEQRQENRAEDFELCPGTEVDDRFVGGLVGHVSPTLYAKAHLG